MQRKRTGESERVEEVSQAGWAILRKNPRAGEYGVFLGKKVVQCDLGWSQDP